MTSHENRQYDEIQIIRLSFVLAKWGWRGHIGSKIEVQKYFLGGMEGAGYHHRKDFCS